MGPVIEEAAVIWSVDKTLKVYFLFNKGFYKWYNGWQIKNEPNFKLEYFC